MTEENEAMDCPFPLPAEVWLDLMCALQRARPYAPVSEHVERVDQLVEAYVSRFFAQEKPGQADIYLLSEAVRND